MKPHRYWHLFAIAAFAALFIAAGPTQAEVFKCVRAGEVVYQQEPCDRAAAQTQLAPADGPAGVNLAPGRAPSSRAAAPAGRQPAPTPPLRAPAGCKYPWGELPADAIVLAATIDGNTAQTDFPIDTSGITAQVQELVVNQPGKRVALMLSFSIPTVWHVKWTRGTQIVAVWASGDDRQAVAGLPRSVPVLETSRHAENACGRFTFYRESFPMANEYARKAFNRPVQQAYSTRGPVHTVGPMMAPGTAVETSNEVTVASMQSKEGRAYGRVAIAALERDGYVRKSLRKELWEWQDAWMAKQDVPPVDNPERVGRPEDRIDLLMVLKPFQLPKGLSGANSAAFIVPKGMSRPSGDVGHGGFIDWNTMTCCGGAYGCPGSYKPCNSEQRAPGPRQ